jgi:hypothetical protein
MIIVRYMVLVNGEKHDYCNGVCTYRGAMYGERITMHIKDLKFALVVE